MSNITEVITLFHPIDVSVDGKIQACHELIIKGPSAKNFKTISKLKSIVSKIILEVTNSDKLKKQTASPEVVTNDADSKLDSESVNQLLYCFSDKIDYYEIAELVKEILINGGATALGIAMGNSLYSKLAFEDIENVTGGYIAHFLL